MMISIDMVKQHLTEKPWILFNFFSLKNKKNSRKYEFMTLVELIILDVASGISKQIRIFRGLKSSNWKIFFIVWKKEKEKKIVSHQGLEVKTPPPVR